MWRYLGAAAGALLVLVRPQPPYDIAAEASDKLREALATPLAAWLSEAAAEQGVHSALATEQATAAAVALLLAAATRAAQTVRKILALAAGTISLAAIYFEATLAAAVMLAAAGLMLTLTGPLLIAPLSLVSGALSAGVVQVHLTAPMTAGSYMQTLLPVSVAATAFFLLIKR